MLLIAKPPTSSPPRSASAWCICLETSAADKSGRALMRL